MTYTYRLAGEDLELAEAELNGFLESQGLEEKADRRGRLAETDSEPLQLKRLALTHEVMEKKVETVLEDIDLSDIEVKGSFAVRCKSLRGETDTEKIEEELGEKLSSPENQVDLENPETEILAYTQGERLVAGKTVQDIDRGLFKKRKNQERPFSSPVSLDPVLARILVNLTGIRPGEKILDPFCGTGGILIEAGLCGVEVYGLDLQEKMVKGTQKNLEEYGILRHDIRKGKISKVEEVFDTEFDAVVTDLPYGKASHKKGNPAEEFIKKTEKLTDGKTVFMSNQEQIKDLKPEFEIYVHKNLTRYIYRFER
ncbi:MAG: methyltransferase domain-containing protein [Candidatus Nanohalobium sp.]